jgi:hypothetical protein
MSIIYLSGAVVPEALSIRPDFGVLFNPLMGNNPKDVGVFALDNGVFTEWQSKGKKPFSLPRFLGLLDKWAHIAGQALFAAAPDRFGDWRGSVERSLPVLPLIRELGYKAAFVAQNGLEYHLAKIPWSAFDVLFLGGGPEAQFVTKENRRGEWKLSWGARRLCELALRKGKQIHMGRVNSEIRIRAAAAMGCASADGTFLARRGRDQGVPEVHGWLDSINEEVAA